MRCAPPTRIACSRPAFTCGSASSGFSIMKLMRPPSMSMIAGAPPLYGMCATSIPAMAFRLSPARCCELAGLGLREADHIGERFRGERLRRDQDERRVSNIGDGREVPLHIEGEIGK